MIQLNAWKLLSQISITSVLLSSCSLVPPMSSPSDEGKKVTLLLDQQQASSCVVLADVTGYGGSEKEAKYDLQHNAAVEFGADAVLLNTIEDFYQRKRMINYHREPQLTARKGTTDYFYLYPFEFKAIGLALNCDVDQ